MMLCEKPFMKTPVGVSEQTAKLNFEARDALTPFGCGQCLPCRINKSRIWQHRLMLESHCHPFSVFLILTYNDENLPHGGTLVPKDVTDYLKRIRFRLEGRKIRYFYVGEYGTKSDRPHYHLILYNVSPLEEKILSEKWDKGFTYVGSLTEHSAQYVCGYVIKNMKKNDPRLQGRYPEFMRCSKMDGGLGKGAVVHMAKQMFESPHREHLEKLDSLSYGKTRRSLGRYLSKVCESILPELAEKRESKYLDYQMELIDNYLPAGNLYRDAILSESDGRRRQMAAKQKFFQKARVL